jgi:predicted amidohydrolase YtcJ
MPARLLFNADVVTVDERFSRHDAVLVEHAKIAAVGALADLERSYPAAERLDLAGKTVIPGFVDAHHHMLLGAIYGTTVDCHPAQAPSIEAIQRALHERSRSSAPPAWIVGLGFDQWRLPRLRAPDRDDLDRAVCERPVLLLHHSFHQGVANSRALELCGIDERTPDPPGGQIERDRRGRPTGRLFEIAFSRVEAIARSSVVSELGGDLFEAIRGYQQRLLACGITRLCDPTVPRSLRPIYFEARARGVLSIPIVMMPVSEQGYLVQPWELLEEAAPGSGPEALRSGPLKLFFDGAERCALCLSPGQAARSLLSATALSLRERSLRPLRALASAPARRGADRLLHAGTLFYSGAEANEIVARAVERGYAVAIHALGNEAVAQALTALARVRKLHPEHPPPRIEHALMLDDALVLRAAELGVMVVTQPAFLEPLGAMGVPELGGLELLPLRTLADCGVRVASSSDGPIGFDPLLALRAAVTRRATATRKLHPEQAISPESWLRMATREGARAAASLDVAGSIEPGKRADLVVLNHSPLDPKAIDTLRVDATLLAGELVYGSLSA